MTRQLRTAISWAFIAAFLACAPLVVLYTAGYKYSWKKIKVEKTGIIQADSVPAGATVFLNDEQQGAVTPAPIARLLPETYRVRFALDGYFPWEKTVDVRSGETAFVTNAALIKESLPQLVQEADVLAFGADGDGAHAAYLAATADGTELRLSASGAAPSLLARFPAGAHQDPHIDWSPNGLWFLYTAHTAKGVRIAIAYPVKLGAEPIALHERFKNSAIRDVSWSSDGVSLVVRTVTGTFIANTATDTVATAETRPDVQDVLLRDRTVFVLRTVSDSTILERRTLGSDAEPHSIATLPSGAYAFLRIHDGPYLLVADRGQGTIRVMSPDDGVLADEVTGTSARWLSGSRVPRLLSWNDFEISVSDVRAHDHRLVTRIGERIRSCAWHPSGAVVLYSTATGIRAADVDDREPRNVFTLVHFDTVSGFAVDVKNGVIRFSGAVGNQRGIFEREF